MNRNRAWRAYRVPKGFYKHICTEEGHPGVAFRRALTSLIHGPLRDENRENLVDELAEDGEKDEDSKELVLEPTLGIVNVEERQANEQSL